MLGRKVTYVRCINLYIQHVAKGIRLLDYKHFCLYRKNFMEVRAFERYIPEFAVAALARVVFYDYCENK